MTKDSLGDRMKKFYEDRNRTYLARRTPVIIRVDGKAFHTLTRKAEKPFDFDFIEKTVCAAERTANHIQGFKLGYVQSDEASFLLTDFDELNTEAWFDYNVQKLCSVTAAMMTYQFNRNRPDSIPKDGLAVFDARCFNIPKEEVSNYFLWRAKDWERNSVSMFARAFFSDKELHGKGRADMHEMLFQKGQNWADLPPRAKNGTFFGTFWERFNIQATYDSISREVDRALAPKEGKNVG